MQQTPALYLALGDSLTAGSGASDPSRTDYPQLVTDVLRVPGRNIELSNLAVPGETSAGFLGASAGLSPQIDRAVGLLQTRQVDLVTLSIGANDLLALLRPGQPCDTSRARRGAELRTALEAPACRAAAEARIAEVRANLATALGRLLQAKTPSTRLVLLLYYNPLLLGLDPGLDALTEEDTRRLNSALREAAAASGASSVEIVDLHAAFGGRVAQLTHAAERDVHPNDAGHRAVAGAVLRALPAAETGFFSLGPAGEHSCPGPGRWQALYWRGATGALLGAVSVLCPGADRFWVNRAGRWSAVAPLLPGVSDPISVVTGEAVFVHGAP